MYGPPVSVLQVADLNALAELGKVYQDSLALSAQLRNLSSFRLQQDKVLGRGSLAVVQEGAQRSSCTIQALGPACLWLDHTVPALNVSMLAAAAARAAECVSNVHVDTIRHASLCACRRVCW